MIDRIINPYDPQDIDEAIAEAIRTAKMEKELRKHGTPVPGGGYALTSRQLDQFFQGAAKRR